MSGELMRVLAGRERGMWTLDELVTAAHRLASEVRDGVALLRRHDVIVEEAAGVRIAAELMRRWIAMKSGGQP